MSGSPSIVLVRHGKPAKMRTHWIPGRALGHLIRAYDDIGISQETLPPPGLLRIASSCECVVTSDLRRARESAARLAPQRDVHIDPELREAVLPDSVASGVPLPPQLWVVIGRIGWWLDWCDSAETIDATRDRASRATDRLCALATHGSVIVVGHGMFNRFIATELLKRKWRGPRYPPRAYWTWARYDFTADG